jgi:hypothetical protein
MEFEVKIHDDGRIELVAKGGTFDEAKLKASKLFQSLQASGLQFDVIGQPEQHRHDNEKVRVSASGTRTHAH